MTHFASKCFGYDENGKVFNCPNTPGTKWTKYWCLECDTRRRERITKQLEDIQRSFGDGSH